MPWETHGEITRPPKGYVKWFEWAYRPEGFKQVGCIYTAQGFEFDYVGVIIGDDLTFDPATKRLVGNIGATKDPTLRKSKENFELHVKNIYRTLLTRGMRGCYVISATKRLRTFFGVAWRHRRIRRARRLLHFSLKYPKARGAAILPVCAGNFFRPWSGKIRLARSTLFARSCGWIIWRAGCRRLPRLGQGATQHQNQSTAFCRKDRRKIDGTENQRWVILSFHFRSDRFKGGKKSY